MTFKKEKNIALDLEIKEMMAKQALEIVDLSVKKKITF